VGSCWTTTSRREKKARSLQRWHIVYGISLIFFGFFNVFVRMRRGWWWKWRKTTEGIYSNQQWRSSVLNWLHNRADNVQHNIGLWLLTGPVHRMEYFSTSRFLLQPLPLPLPGLRLQLKLINSAVIIYVFSASCGIIAHAKFSWFGLNILALASSSYCPFHKLVSRYKELQKTRIFWNWPMSSHWLHH
jgi:hypothetical protein